MTRTTGLLLACSLTAFACGNDAPLIEEDPSARQGGDGSDTEDAPVDASMRDAGSRIDAGTIVKQADAGKPDAAVAETPTLRPRCVNKPSQVVVVGDSYINWITHSFPEDIQKVSGQKGWRMEAIGAASIGSGGATKRIPKQFDDAVAANPDVHTVLMDGGGNDVLVPAPSIDPEAKCKNRTDSPTLPECQKIVETALTAGRDVMKRAAAAGVRDVVYFFYPTVPEGTLVGGEHPNAINEYALPKVRELCETAVDLTDGKLRCHFVDMVPVFKGHEDEYFFPADIHPNSKGSMAMAEAVWDTMKKNCIAQPASSGCCEP